MNILKKLVIAATGLFVAYTISGCADPLTGHRTNHFTGVLSLEGRRALSETVTGIVTAVQVYDALGNPGLSDTQAAQYAKYKPAMYAAANYFQAYVGKPLPPATFDTGSDIVNAAVLSSINPGATVTQADANAMYRAAAIVDDPN